MKANDNIEFAFCILNLLGHSAPSAAVVALKGANILRVQSSGEGVLIDVVSHCN
jgi:hypothetical protein